MNTRDRRAYVRTVIEEGVFNTERGMNAMVDRIVEKWDEDVDGVQDDTYSRGIEEGRAAE
jgi:hypothetical protein